MSWKHRHTVLGVLCCASLLCYLDRMVMATAIPFVAKDFHLSPLAMGGVLSAFFTGYAVMQIPGGLLADHFGSRLVLASSIAWFSVMTLATGFASGVASMMAIRVSFGVGEGPYPPAAAKALASWFPQKDVGRANGLQLGATGVGATLAPLFVVALMVRWGWRSVFYILFIPGLLLAFLIWCYVRNVPAQSPRVSPAELQDYESLATAPSTRALSPMETLRSPAVQWCALTLFVANIVNWGLMNWLPTYLLEARGFGVERMGTFAALTNFAGAVGSVLGGYLCDRWFGSNLRIPIVVGLVISAALTLLAAVAPTGEWAVVFMTAVFLISNIAYTAIFTLPIVIVPKHSVGGAAGIVNTAGQVAGVLSPLIVGAVLEVTRGDFKTVLYGMVGLTFLAVLPAMRIKQTAEAA